MTKEEIYKESIRLNEEIIGELLTENIDLKNYIEHLGEIADICTVKNTSVQCKYCRCDGSNF